MKLNGQSRSFVKQVQLDLVALDDADLCNVVQQWIDGSHSSEEPFDIPEETRLALGYPPWRRQGFRACSCSQEEDHETMFQAFMRGGCGLLPLPMQPADTRSRRPNPHGRPGGRPQRRPIDRLWHSRGDHSMYGIVHWQVSGSRSERKWGFAF